MPISWQMEPSFVDVHVVASWVKVIGIYIIFAAYLYI